MKLYTTSEAAQLLGVGRQRVLQYVQDGRLVPFRRDPHLYTLQALVDLQNLILPTGRPPNGENLEVSQN